MNKSSKHYLIIGLTSFLLGFVALQLIKVSPQSIYIIDGFDNKLMLLFAVLIAPIIEELVFRYGLIVETKWKKYIYYTIVVIAVFALTKSAMIGLVFLLLFILLLKLKNRETYYRVIVVSLAFAFAHLLNVYEVGLLFITFYLLVLFGMSMILSYFRLKYGLIVAILAHALYNGSVKYIGYKAGPEQLSFQDEHLDLRIEKMGYFDEGYLLGNMEEDSVYNQTLTNLIKIKLAIHTADTSIVIPAFSNKNKYVGHLRLSDSKGLPKLLELLQFRIDTISEEGTGYLIYENVDSAKVFTDLEKVNPIFNRGYYGSSFGSSLVKVAQELYTPIKINLDRELLDNKLNINFNLELSFEENIQLINKEHNLGLSYKPIKLQHTKLILRSE